MSSPANLRSIAITLTVFSIAPPNSRSALCAPGRTHGAHRHFAAERASLGLAEMRLSIVGASPALQHPHDESDGAPGAKAGGRRAHQHHLEWCKMLRHAQLRCNFKPGRAAEYDPANHAHGKPDGRLAPPCRQKISYR